MAIEYENPNDKTEEVKQTENAITKKKWKIQENNSSEEKENNLKRSYPPISFLHLYKYATTLDKLLILLGTIFSVVAAIATTLLSLLFGDATGAIVNYVTTVANNSNTTEVLNAEENLVINLTNFVIRTCSFALAIFFGTYCSTVLFNYSALRQTFRIREMFLKSILNQDIAWYDVNQTGDFASRVSDDLKKVEEGIGEKASIFIYYEVIFVSSILQGLIQGWELALVCMISIPITTLSMGFVSWISSQLASREMEAYGEATAISEEVLSSIRTVVAFGGQEIEHKRYSKWLNFAMKNNIKRSLFNGISNGILWFVTYSNFSLAFWYGVGLILTERDLPEEEVVYNAGNMTTVFFSILVGTWYFGMASPYIEIFGIAKGAGAKIYAIIVSEPIINESKGVGLQPHKLEGNIVFEDVDFNYPSRPNVKILQGLNLKVSAGETVALIGSSGCGKSTCIQLIQRFYDPASGKVYIDNNNISKLDLSWLRNRIGVVGQEPVLFEATIAGNIRYGCKEATQEDIERAARKANAHSFISALPQGYDTWIGERGAQLSGGQKQRIAIARALVRQPAILLLDEATSALDTNSEAVVQAALDAASNECTTIIVAHRLSTVRNADRIVVLANGKVQEQGSHDQLIAAQGAYYQLINSQITRDEEGEPTVEFNNGEKPTQVRPDSIEAYGKKSSYISFNGAAIIDETTQSEKTYSIWAIMKYNSQEWWALTISCICSLITGASMPIYGILFGKVIGVLAHEDPQYVRNETNTYSLYILIVGISCGVATLFQIYTFGIAGEKLTMRLRSLMFKAILNQEMAWFDDKENGVGSLCARLSGDAANIQGATGQRIGTMLNSMATVVISLGAACYFDWRLALVAICFAPIIVVSIGLEQRIIAKEGQGQYKSLQQSTKIAVEAISGIRTVASLSCEQTFVDLYMAEIVPYEAAARKNTHFRGLVYGVSRSSLFFAYAAVLYYGGMLVKDEQLNYANVFIVTECIISSSWSLANALAFTPNLQKGIIAANRILRLLHRVPKIVNGDEDVNAESVKGNIKYEQVHFSYPTRPTIKVLKGLNLSVLQGKMVALVGPSGCGKSTIIQLLERFYDPSHGRITTEGKSVGNMKLAALRSHLGIVSQEPNLFNKTIAENIAYGDNSRTVSNEEIIDAAKKANIHNFIASLPLGYDTKLGDKGTQLSGGQKQRVAIARALVRNPKVLLLDEATSALDAESEKVVQDALNIAKVGRTCITIAHRLTTIQDADVICVINCGRVAEMGTHSELLSLKGLYYNLRNLQNGLT